MEDTKYFDWAYPVMKANTSRNLNTVWGSGGKSFKMEEGGKGGEICGTYIRAVPGTRRRKTAKVGALGTGHI